MGDINQLLFIKRFSEGFESPFLEVGSKNYGNTQDLRSLFSEKGLYIGIDLTEGEGVDLVLDMTKDFIEINNILKGKRFGTIFCLSVLEHCDQPFKMAENLTLLLKKGGKIFISAPFSWQFHGYPSDYWRFTHEGIKKLFPRLSFDFIEGVSAIPSFNKFFPLDKEIGKISFSSKKYWSKGQILKGISAKLLKLLSKVGILKWLVGHRYLLVPTNIYMVGVLDK